MTCLKVKKEAKLEECAVPWSGDTISVCNKCRMSIWDLTSPDMQDIPDVNDNFLVEHSNYDT